MSHAQQLQAGMLIDGYQLEQKMHTGGMAALWRVTDTLGRHLQDGQAPPLMMKVPLLFTTEDPTAIVAFEVEQMIMPKLKGRHVPRFFSSGDFDTQPYIVMEQIAGVSLRARFDEAPLPETEVIDIGIRVARALQDLHKQHVIHLDIKPSNIMFRETGEAVLIDYGLSHHTRLPDLLDEEFRLPLGTGPYISPEQVSGIRTEARSDLFALGVLLYHLATGQRPFGNPTSIPGLKKRLYRDPIPPRHHKTDLSPWLQEVILCCLEVKAELRYQSAAQLAFLLQHPQQINLSARATKLQQDGLWHVIKRRFALNNEESRLQSGVAQQLSLAPIIAVALDLSNSPAALSKELLQVTRQILQTVAGARLACLTIRKTSRLGMDEGMIQGGENIHVKQLVDLKHWAQGLHDYADKITYHVLEAPDPASAIIEYAHNNQVDHIIIGSRGSSALRRYLGSVSAQVVAEAECTVTVVKAKLE